MMLVWAALCMYAVQWIAGPHVDAQWEFLLGTQTLAIASLVSGVAVLTSGKHVLTRSVMVLWALMAWADFGKFILWNYSDKSIDVSPIIAALFSAWLLHLYQRRYDRDSDTLSANTVMLLFKRPKHLPDLIKSLIGAPTSSICFYIDGKVWSFRKRTKRFECFDATPEFMRGHVAIDTGCRDVDTVSDALDSLTGTPRGAACKCVWTIRHVLRMLGARFEIKTWFDYVPSLYMARIL